MKGDKMKLFANMKIEGRLVLGFTTMILFMVIIGAFGFQSIRNIQGNLTDIFTIHLPSMDYLIETDRDLQQLLVAERTMLAADAGSDEFKRQIKDYEQNLKQSDERWNKFKKLPKEPNEMAFIDKYDQVRAEWQPLSKKVVDLCTENTGPSRKAAQDLTLGAAAVKFEEMRNQIDELTNINLANADKAQKEATATYRRTIYLMLGIFGLGVLAAVLMGWQLRLSITVPLKRIITGLTTASSKVAYASEQVSASSQHLAEGSSEQASSLEETSSSLEEMASMTKQNADNANQAKAMMTETRQIVEKVDNQMNRMAASIGEITKTSEETGKIIKTIDEIAFQTNLLALNAAVEAARAGEAGAGFAVVADEVRNLAMRAAEAAKNTNSLIENTIKAVREGNELTQATREAFKENVSNATKVAQLIDEIAAASQEQAQGIGQINKAVSEMDKVTQQTAASAEESASASEELNAQANQMKGYVDQLTNMVGRSGASLEAAAHKPGEGTAKASPRKALPAPAKKKTTSPAGKPLRPEQVLPLEEGEFKDF